jgi:translation initiation factor IF-3
MKLRRAKKNTSRLYRCHDGLLHEQAGDGHHGRLRRSSLLRFDSTPASADREASVLNIPCCNNSNSFPFAQLIFTTCRQSLKMPPTHISGTSRALYRVFIAPNLRNTTSIPLLYAPAFAPTSSPTSVSSSTPSLTSQTSTRGIKYTKDTRRHAISDYYVIDRAIEADLINFVDEEGVFHKNVPLDEALTSFNKVTHHLVQMSEGKYDEAGNLDPDHLPTCRVISKISLRQQHQRKLETLRRQAKGQSAGPATKTLELNWAIAGGDLKHRLVAMKKFLTEGRKVEITLGPKKHGRKATSEEANAVFKTVEVAVAECEGSKEVKREGEVGGILTVVYEGKKVEKEGKKVETKGNDKTT